MKASLVIRSVIFCMPIVHALASVGHAETTLSAVNTVDPYLLTYEAFNNDPEVPDCGHPIQHITPYFDSTFQDYVFNFHSHRDHDDDRCIIFDRQRTEVAVSWHSSPALTASQNQIHSYRWKFRLNSGFQPSSSFTHIFQLTADGPPPVTWRPVFNFTLRKGSPDKLEMLYRINQKLKTVSLQGFKGHWVEAFVKVKYSDNGWIEVELRRLSDGVTLLSWSKSGLDLWQFDNTGTVMRPKWGVYRSLNNIQNLRDEHTHFNDFCIAEGSDTCTSYFDPVPPVPASVTGPFQVNGGNYSISWSASSGATRYELWESYFGGPFSKVYDGPSTGKGFSSKPSGEYTYKVKACNGNGCSAFSATHFCMVCNPTCV